MQNNSINFKDFVARYFDGEEFLFMYKNLSLYFKIIDGAHILEYSDGFKIKYMQLKNKDYIYNVTMNGISILNYWDEFVYAKK